MRKFFRRCSEFCVPMWPFLAILVALAVLFAFVVPARAQVVCTYADQTGTTRNCTGMAQLNQLRAITNSSGGIATGGTSQQVFAANPARQWLYIANPSNAGEPLYVNFGIAANPTNSIVLQPGGIVQFVSGVTPVTPVTVSAATQGHAFVAMEGN